VNKLAYYHPLKSRGVKSKTGEWLTDLHYRRTMVITKTWYGKLKKKLGYELIRPLTFKDRTGRVFHLETGYVWDGVTAPDWLSWLIGDLESPPALAASAIHDTFRGTALITREHMLEIHETPYRMVEISYAEGGRIYSAAYQAAGGNKWTARFTSIGIALLQPVLGLISEQWEIVKAD
jgi:hypothetical protein